MIYNSVQKLIDYSLKKGLIAPEDVYVVRNGLMEAVGLNDWVDNDTSWDGKESIDDVLAPIVEYACSEGVIPDTSNSRDLFDTKLMGVVTPMPREIASQFKKIYSESPKKATDWYFDFSKDTNYVRAGRIAKDLKWPYESEYGTLDITINCSKPEKDPRDIAAARNAKAQAYPKCQLCAENAGFAGHANHPARQNLRPINIKVNGEDWQLQYSPYGYYNEHCIAFNTSHVPMKIDKAVFDKMFDIIEYLPHYFVGSNADLPIVGGSILSHEHFQGGNYTFAMAKAKNDVEFNIIQFPSVTAGILNWPMSVIRLTSERRDELVAFAVHVLDSWRKYSDGEAGIFAETDGVPHNTITPICRMVDDQYQCDLVLRNNITTEERPLGVFHPNPSLHHIKKENIGLIEVMGLAVLPARLVKEIDLLADAILEGRDVFADERIASHGEWVAELKEKYEFTKENVIEILKDEIGKVFAQVLEDAGVFKNTKEGRRAFVRFIDSLYFD